MWMILAKTARRDRLLLLLDMTGALRLSELFALRWRSFDNQNTLTITETVYRRKIRPCGKTSGSLRKVHLPGGLAAELRRWKLECKNRSPEAFIFRNADGGFIDTANYRFRVLKPLAQGLGIQKLNFQILRRTMATQAQRDGFGQGYPSPFAARTTGHNRLRIHAGIARERTGNGQINERDAPERRGLQEGTMRLLPNCYQGSRESSRK
jgi:integrase